LKFDALTGEVDVKPVIARAFRLAGIKGGNGLSGDQCGQRDTNISSPQILAFMRMICLHCFKPQDRAQ